MGAFIDQVYSMARNTVTGADFKAFYTDPAVWGEGKETFYIEDDTYLVNGKEFDYEQMYKLYGDDFKNLPDNAKIAANGYVAWQGTGSRPEGVPEDLSRLLSKWIKAHNVRTLVATFDIDLQNTPAAELQMLLTTLQGMGAKVQGVGIDDLKPIEEAPKARAPRPR